MADTIQASIKATLNSGGTPSLWTGTLNLERSPDFLLHDTFAGSGDLASHTMDVGDGWTEHTGSWEIDSNQLKCSADNAVASADAGKTDLAVTVRLVMAGPNQNGVVARLVDGDHFFVFTKAGNLVEKNGGTSTVRASASITVIDGDTIGIKVVGNDITCYHNGSEVLAYAVDAEQSYGGFATATRAGLYVNTDPNVRFDNFEVVES